MKRKIMFLSVVFSIIGGLLFAGPFGINMGDSLETLQSEGLIPRKIDGTINKYYVTPPSPHSEFESYSVDIDDDKGVYFIRAVSKDISDSGYGTNTKSHFGEIRNAIDSNGTYGKSELLTMLLPRSIWNESRDWMMSLYKEERLHVAFWQKPDGTNFSGNIGKVYLAAFARSSSRSYLVLEYYGVNHEALSEKAKSKSNVVF